MRGLSGEMGIPVWTASQTNRSIIDSEVIEADKIDDSYAKVMNDDFIMSWSRKSKDKLNNTARAHIMKNRFGPDGITFPCKMDTNTGFIEVYEGTSIRRYSFNERIGLCQLEKGCYSTKSM